MARTRPKLKVAVTLGHTPLRLYVLGKEAADREAAEAEIGHMCKIVCEAMDTGAIGFASSRQPAYAGAGASRCRVGSPPWRSSLRSPSRWPSAAAVSSPSPAAPTSTRRRLPSCRSGAAGRLDGAERQAPRAGRLIRDGGASAGPVG